MEKLLKLMSEIERIQNNCDVCDSFKNNTFIIYDSQ